MVDPVRSVVAAWRRTRDARMVRRFAHGAGGTSLVWVDGRVGVLKAWPLTSPATAVLPAALERMQAMAARGVRVPAVLERGACGDYGYVLYEVLPGRWPARVSARLVDDLVAVVDAERGAAGTSNPRWSDELARMLDAGDPLFDIDPAAVAAHPAGRRLLDEARRRLDHADPAHLQTSDVVHADFAPENVLVEAGRLVGVVDWERCRIGDAGLDLVGAVVDVGLRRTSAVAARRLWASTRARVPADALALYVGVYVVRYASWALGTSMEAEVLALADRLLAATTAIGD